MATFIDFVLEDEQALEVSRFLNKIKTKGKEGDDAFEKECAKLIEGKKVVDLLKRLADESLVILTEATDKEIEGFYFILVSLLKKLPNDNHHDVLMRIINALTSPAEDKSLLRLRILSNLHDILQEANLKYELFVATLKFAHSTRHVDLVLPHFKDIESRIKEWGINSKQTRELYKLIRDSLKASHKSNSIEAYTWTIKYLATFEAGFDPSEAGSAREEAINAALDAIRLPDLYQFDTLLDSLPIKQLESDNNNNNATASKIQTSKLLQLLKIFVSGGYEDFVKFNSENPDFLKSAGLDQEECTRKMRLLSLATLAAANQEVPYGVIAKSLQVPEDEVEVWVIMAIGESILEGKMDQLRKLVIISRSLQRVFTPAQWKQLGDRLTLWKGNIKLILNTLQDCKQQQQTQLHAALTSTQT
jgi:translation initiation factor 3 subunit M